jgi:hypothetical protein
VITFLSAVLVTAGVSGVALAVVGRLMYPAWPTPCFVGAVTTLTISVGDVLGGTSFVSVVVAVIAYLVAWEWMQVAKAHESTTDV